MGSYPQEPHAAKLAYSMTQYRLVPVPGETLVTFEIKIYSHEKYAL